jgi:hypothetical protein
MDGGPSYSEASPQQESLLEYEATQLYNPAGNLPEIKFMVKLADHIYKQVKGYMKGKADEALIRDVCLEHFRGMYPKFSKSYPTVLRYMIQLKQYSSKALEKYLRLIEKTPWLNDDEFLQSQVDYIMMLQRTLHTHYNTKTLAVYRKEIEETLVKEKKDFHAKQEEAEKRVEAADQVVKEERRSKLMEFLKSYEGNKLARNLVEMQGESLLGDNLKSMEDKEQFDVDAKIKQALRKKPASVSL